MASLWPGTEGPGIRYITNEPPKAWQRARARNVVFLGSTGSIGGSALEIARANPDTLKVTGLACAKNVARLAEQAVFFKAPHLAVLDDDAAKKLETLLPRGYAPHIHVGKEGYRELASLDEADTVLSAQVGAAGLAGTLAAALAGKVICLANKESLMQAGDLLRLVCGRTGASILPVDSEHHALFDALAGRGDEADCLVLTASGGPFRGKSLEELENVGPEAALKHPNWAMGAKITIDSATLMNKALELIEACHLYGVAPERVRVLVHPQSIVHSLVVFKDGSQLAQMAVPDMKLPIGNCLLWPRVEKSHVAPLSLADQGTLSFERVASDVFPAIDLARKAMSVRSGLSIVLNAADEAAVGHFLKGRCGFNDITRAVSAAMERRALGLKTDAVASKRPFCLAGSLAALEGEKLAQACDRALLAIEELTRETTQFVDGYLRENRGPKAS